MKNIPVLFAALLLAAACNKANETPASDAAVEYGTVEFNISVPEAAETKAISQYSTVQPYEAAVKSVQLLVFDEDGKLNLYQNGTSLSGSFTTTSGGKTVWAVINGPDLSSISTLDAMRGSIFDLSLNETGTNGSFVMAGEKFILVGATSSSNCAITAKRFLSRIALVSVTNNLPASYGTITIKRVFLSNVSGSIAANGDFTSACGFINQNGRADKDPRSEADIIGTSGNEASCPALTCNSNSFTLANSETQNLSDPILLYAYQNNNRTAPDGFHSPYVARGTTLVVEASINNQSFYYPVLMKNGVGRNKLYTVGLTLTALGSSDPDVLVEKGTAAFSISIAEWESGATYEETI